MRRSSRTTLLLATLLLATLLLGGCSVHDSRTALRAQHSLVGMSEEQVETCLGAPDQRATFGETDILTYAATSTSSASYSIPIVGGLGLSNGGSCKAILRVQGGKVASVRYLGEDNALGAQAAYCAPIVRGCVTNPPPPDDPVTGAVEAPEPAVKPEG